MKNYVYLLAAAVALCAGAEETVGSIRHMADTYLQSDCTQYIDTGYIGTTNMRVEVVFEPVVTNGTRYLFGSASNISGNSPMKYGVYVQNGGISFSSGTGAGVNWSSGWFSVGKVSRSHYKAVYDYPKRTAELWSGDVRIYNHTSLASPGFETNTCTVTIFCNHLGPTSCGDWFGGKLYSFRLYDKGTLIRDMVPYGRGAVTGLLDRCSGKVYTNARSGHPFVLGTDDGYVRSDRAKTSGQFVNTGYYVNPQTKIELDFALMDVTTTWQSIFGALKGSELPCTLAIDGSKKFTWTLNDGDDYTWNSTGIAADGARRTFTLDIPNASVTLANAEGTEYTATIDSVPTATADIPLRIFGNVSTNATGAEAHTGASSVRVYGMKIWNGDTLVRNYEPRLVDNVEGLYDSVNGTFSTPDLSGSTTVGKYRLTCGGNIVSTSANGVGTAANADAYLHGTGGQGIETDYYPSRKSRLEIDFSINAFNGTDYFFGAVATTLNNTNNVGLYYQKNNNNSARNLNFRHWNSSNNNTTWPNIGSNMTAARYQVVMDLPNAKGYIYKDGAQLKSINLGLPSGEFRNTVPLRILSTQSDGQNCAHGRIYSFSIYEDDVLVHRYTPCVQNDIAGVWDSVDKRFFGNYKTADGSGFTFHGAGVDGGGMVFTEQPQGCRISHGHTATLTVFAPGAAGYQWLKNGEVVEGAVGRTLEVPYGKGGTTDTYQCVSHYALFGYGVSDVAQIENLPSGTVLMVR